MTVAKFFSCRNIALFWTCMILILSYFLYTPIPKGFSEPWKLQIMLASMKTISFLGVVSESVGYRSRLNISRSLLNVACRPIQSSPELQVTNTLFDGVPVRIYKPSGLKTPVPAMIYFHGGGWCSLGLDHYDVLTSQIAKKANIIVVSVEYRLAPEHPFPIPFDDCVTATLHLLQESSRYGVDSKRVAIGGDSAGGNLAAAVSLKLRDSSQTPGIKCQILVYPVLQNCDWFLPSFETSIKLFTRAEKGMFFSAYANISSKFRAALEQGEFISESVRKKCLRLVDSNLLPSKYRTKGRKPTDEYVTENNSHDLQNVQRLLVDPYMFPLMSENLENLPDTFLLSAEYDSLRDENLIFGERLKRANNNVIVKNYEQGVHGCVNLIKSVLSFSAGDEMLADIVEYISNNL